MSGATRVASTASSTRRSIAARPILFPTAAALEANDQEFTYGRLGTPTVKALAEAIAELEGGHATLLTPSGLSAIATSFLALLSAGDHVLVSDSVYRPTRRFCDNVLKRLGIETTYYDPLVGAGIKSLLKPNTKMVFAESPGSQTFEVQDIPAIAEAAHAAGALLVLDNTWATPLFYKSFAHGADVSIQAATKYIVGHADAMLGAITANEAVWPKVARTHDELGLCPGPEDVYLGLRGLRSLGVRLARHQASGLALAEWLAEPARGRPRDPPRTSLRSGPRHLEARLHRRLGPVRRGAETGIEKGRGGDARRPWSCSAWAIAGAASRA